jgi:hypothetical protein
VLGLRSSACLYSPNLVEEDFSELRLFRVLGSSPVGLSLSWSLAEELEQDDPN